MGRSSTRDRFSWLPLAIPTWLLSAAFWTQEAIDPLTAPALLLDRFLQTITLLLVPAAALLLVATIRGGQRTTSKATAAAATLTGVVGMLLAGAVLLGGIIRPPRAWEMVGAATFVLVSGAALAAIHSRRVPALRSVPGGLLAFFVASAIPLLELGTSAAFLPSRIEASLNQNLTIRVEDAATAEYRTVVEYTAANPTDQRVVVLLTRLDVCWSESRGTPVAGCEAFRPIAERSWISPKSELHYAQAIAVPRDRPWMTAKVRIAFARGDRLRLGDGVTLDAGANKCRDVRVVRLVEGSRVQDLAEPEKRLVIGDFDRDGGRNYRFDAARRPSCPPEDPDDIWKFFGVTDGTQIRQTWLVPPKK